MCSSSAFYLVLPNRTLPRYLSVYQQIQKDAAAEVPPPDMITDGGQDPTQRSCAFLELALCSASGLDDTGLTTLVKVGDQRQDSLFLRGGWVGTERLINKGCGRCAFLELALCSASGLATLVKVGDELHRATGQSMDT